MFITNVVKCRPPDNRDPEPDEIAACAPYLTRQLEVLDPAVVVTLGRFSMARFMPGVRISQAHGTVRPADPATGARDALVLAMYHPAAALRTPAIERESFADAATIPSVLLDARAAGRRAGPGLSVVEPALRTCRRRRRRRLPTVMPRHRSPASPSAIESDLSRPLQPSTGARAHRHRPTKCPSSDASANDPMPLSTEHPLRIIPLGGVGEIGKNLTVFEYGDEIVVIDCGPAFPDEEMFGIDLVIPDITYLKENREKVKAFLITHAHEDHVGGLPYVLPEFPGVPVYASTLARGLLGNKIKEHKLHNNPVLPLDPGDELQIGSFHGHPVPRRPLDPRRHGHRPSDAGRDHRPHGRLQVRPHPGRRQAVRLRDPCEARRRGRPVPAVGLDQRREARVHAVRAHRRRGLPRDHGAP